MIARGMLTERLAHVAARQPDSIALVDRDERLSYRKVTAAADAVARRLKAAGVSPQDRVALVFENSLQYVAALYAVFALRAVAVPLNATARQDDLDSWIQHSGATRVLVNEAHAAHIPARDGREVLVLGGAAGSAGDRAWRELLADGGQGDFPGAPRGDDVALILYTSGTTGKAKGVTLTQRNLAANVDSILAYLKISATDRMVNALPFYYSFGNSVLHTHLAAGATIILEQNLVYPHKVVETLARERATGFAGVPSTFALLTARVDLSKYELDSLRTVQQAGGGLPVAVLTKFIAQLPDVDFFVMYGQTEATARITYLPPHRLVDKRGSAGIPVPGVELEIRREDGSIAAPREIGSIWVRGDNVMRGYWNDPELTATVLRDGWLNTLDQGFVDDDGFLHIDGRRSDIIKTGAHRVQPQDIEATITQLDAVEDVGVVGADDDLLGQVIRAVIVLKEGAELSEMQVKAHCRDRLAAYKVPKFVEFSAELPRTATGKLQRFRLAK
ncbi:MAG TPA: AMP-binding protein [Steroidobacteraceae bacterium]|nr:AMP-binding protein [Steroidobacteraceae bacterium]